MPTSLLPEAFFWTLVKLHVNSLLAMLNSRDSILERSTNLHPETTFYVRSFTHGSTSRPPAVSMNMHQTTTTNFAPCNHNCNVEPKLLDVEKSVRSLHLDAVSEFTWSLLLKGGVDSADLGTQRSGSTPIV
ncbi:hypothetical protein BJV78DRAFT_1282851 [Lactifluus subvellereus]|nr:hypothetical protein BJV78DRAFT_1282851 [Lactifluus subvellereus]